MGSLQPEPDVDTICSILGSEYRRHVLRCLSEGPGTRSARELARSFVEENRREGDVEETRREGDVDPTRSEGDVDPTRSEGDVDPTRVTLRHVHLPTLGGAGAVDYDPRSGAVSITDRGERLRGRLQVLEELPDEDPPAPGSDVRPGTERETDDDAEGESRSGPAATHLSAIAVTRSHDLLNQLDVAEGNLELARRDGGKGRLDAVARVHDRMESLIRDLVTLARTGDRVTDLEPVSLSDVVHECVRATDADGGRLEVEDDPTVHADASRLRQLVDNLVRNALEHGGEGVTVRVGALAGATGFYLADDGPGIPENRREEVFALGYSTRPEGAGYGLSIVATIAEAHGWAVAVTDAESGGARIEVSGVRTG